MKIIFFSFILALCILPPSVLGQTTVDAPGATTDATDAPDVTTGEPETGAGGSPTCECIALCEQCNADGSNTADCQTVCDIAADAATCVTQCDATLHTGDTGATDTGATETGASPTCECVTECDQCNAAGSNTADCQTVCEIAADATTCVEQCDATLHTGDTEATAPPTSEGQIQKIGMVAIVTALVGAVV